MKEKAVYILKGTIVALLVVSFCVGCSLFGKGKKPEKPPEVLMSEGMAKFADGYYEEAAELFRELKDRYPYSNLAIHAELRLGDSLLENDEFEEAIEVYKEFESLHPKNKSIPYVIYQQGMCYFRRIRTIDRDQTNARKALNEFERLIRTFPNNQYSLKAEDHVERCLTNLAEHEFYVGHFYFRNGHYGAALKRFENLLEQYPNHGPREKALDYIARCEQRLAHRKSSQ
ncbi:MAG: outer membrane protein assembly factor BamD [Deltaproteobacteria bacterium]|nr:outer membrane protein assembly factor BamD [Deltaproteobacteria bacterium]MBW2077310.1 outer membrane protein assembly factor BamD [Deltaproteobacteria bacterium]